MSIVSQSEVLIVTTPEAGVGCLTLNRPAARNALNAELMSALVQQLQVWADDPAIRVVMLSGGEGSVFSAGADISELAQTQAADWLSHDPLIQWDKVANFPKPLIAVINGAAIGGGFELAMAADFMLAADNARFALPEVNLGLIPGAGGTQRLTRLVGQQRAMGLILTGQAFTAQQALEWGVVYQVYPSTDLWQQALSLAVNLACKPLLALQSAKQAIYAAQTHGLHEGVKAERQLFTRLFATHDAKEGLQAFLDKRPPQFLHC
jgi:enoyl-CoA hydratase